MQNHAQERVVGGVIWIECDGLLGRRHGRVVIPVNQREGAQESVDIWNGFVECIGSLCQVEGAPDGPFRGIAPTVLCIQPVGPGRQRKCQGVLWLRRGGFFEELAGACILRLHEAVHMRQTLGGKVPRLYAAGGFAPHAHLLSLRQLDLERDGDFVGDLVLQRE